MNYVWHIGTLTCIYAVFGMSLNLVLGYGGMLSFCHASIAATGAYCYSLLVVDLGMQPILAVLLAVVFSASVSLLVALITSRLKGDSFVLGTISIQVILFALFYNCVEVTHGPYGIAGIPRPVVFGTPVRMLALAIAALAIVVFVARQLVTAPFGRVLQAVRDDAGAAESIAKNATAIRVAAFALSGALSAVGGILFALHFRYIDPTSFTLDQSIAFVVLVVLGGSGNLRGPLVGAFVVTLLPECLRLLPIPTATQAELRQVLFGVVIITTMRYRPRGLAGQYAYD